MIRAFLALAFAVAPSIAFAHVGVGDTHGFSHGFVHPMSGIDHVLAMVTVGVFAAHLGGRALWLVPLSFVSMMAVGGALGLAGVAMPFVEIGVGASVVVLGLAVALRLDPPVAVAMALVGFFAVFHGHAHGTEMPSDATGLAYALGFVAATALLHVGGIGLGLLFARSDQVGRPLIVRVAGGGVAVAGIAMLGGMI